MTEEKIRSIKLEKIHALREQGVNPYPERFARTHRLHEAAALVEKHGGVRICGRIVSRREHGKMAFFDLQDLDGRCQCSIQSDVVGAESFKTFSRTVDIGDFLGVEGETYRTRIGHLTLQVSAYQLLGKSLYPLPEKFHAIAEQELRYRRRYLDLIMDPESRARFQLRSRLVSTLRRFLDRHGFVEVETPVLQIKPSGALATPFATHHNALDLDLYLRIAPETYLKRCIVGGYDRVYEVARVFRNEGMDPSHLQDFTMLEYYAAYWNYVDNMDFTEALVRETVAECLGGTKARAEGALIDFAPPWPRRALAELIEEHSGIDVLRQREPQALHREITRRAIALDGAENLGWGALVDQLYKKVARPKLVQPTFVMSHPIELSPLARRSDSDPTVADRFQLVVRGWEVLNAYSELVDPIDQRRRLEEQALLHSAGDKEAMVMDEDYLLAMEHGMPPISGWGMGIDRFAALLGGAENLRDVLLFPLMKPEGGSGGAEEEQGARA